MINNSEYVVSFVTHSFGGASQFMEYAIKRKKSVVNIAKLTELN